MANFDPYLRPPYEWMIAGSWAAAGGLAGYAWTTMPAAEGLLVPAALAGLLALRAGLRGLSLLGRGARGRSLTLLTVKALRARMRKRPDALWFGWGFDWTPEHTQRAVDFMLTELRPNRPVDATWIHGLNQGREDELYIPLKHLEGHTLIVGTTGAGKTKALFEVLIAQAIHRGDVVILIDPKGDKDLKARVVAECARAGRQDVYAFFHPAFPQGSIRLDPLKNFTRTTELASRIAALLPSESGSDAFTAFSFRALNLVCQGLVEIGERPTLKRLRYYIEGGPEQLLVRAIEAYADRAAPDWRASLAPYVELARQGRLPKLERIAAPEQVGLIEWYRKALSDSPQGSEAIDGLMSLVEHNKLHFSKMIAGLIPVLNMLTSGELGPLLSPDASEVADARPILDTGKIIEGGGVAYFGLDALPDAIVASAIGSILLSDLASVAGHIYNRADRPRRISLFVDEASEVVNAPFVQLLNKGRGAGFQITMALQTISDLTARIGDEARARQILGNCNNLIALRIKDGYTQEYVTETFGTTYIRTVQKNLGHSQSSADNVAHFQGSAGRSLQYEEHALFPQHLLGQLPNFHYVAALTGGRVVKGRLPILTA